MRGSRSSCSEIFYRKAFMKHSVKFGGKYLWWSLQTYQKDSITSYYHSWNHLLPWGEGLSFLNSNKKMGLDFSHKRRGLVKQGRIIVLKRGITYFHPYYPNLMLSLRVGDFWLFWPFPSAFPVFSGKGFVLFTAARWLLLESNFWKTKEFKTYCVKILFDITELFIHHYTHSCCAYITGGVNNSFVCASLLIYVC